MIHPDAASDAFLAPLHRSFLISSFVSGAAALIVLPLHLALAGPPHAAVLLVLAWMLSQWPLALFLSRSGALNKTIGVSATLFAGLVAAVCLLTGGASSFALVWLLVPLLETAFATDRKVPVAVTFLCGGLLAGITLLPLPDFQFVAAAPGTATFSVLGALLYTGVLSMRLTLDRMLARRVVHRSEARQQMIAQGTSDVVCAVAADGGLQLLAGPISRLVGPLPLSDGEDWLFPRLHVADRPLYLTRLSDARHDGRIQQFEVRFRVGATQPGETGFADYKRLVVTLQTPVSQHLEQDLPSALLLTLAAAEAPQAASVQGAGTAELSSTERDNRTGVTAQEVPAVAAPLIGPAALRHTDDAAPAEVATVPSPTSPVPEAVTASCDLAASLDQCRDLLTPVAARRGILLDFSAAGDLPPVAVEPKGLRQALNCLLADMIETCGDGAVLLIAADMSAEEVVCEVIVSGRTSAQLWRPVASKSVIDRSAELLARAGARLSLPETEGKGSSVLFLMRPSVAVDFHVDLAKSA